MVLCWTKIKKKKRNKLDSEAENEFVTIPEHIYLCILRFMALSFSYFLCLTDHYQDNIVQNSRAL